MRISDWSSDVCSSDLNRLKLRRALVGMSQDKLGQIVGLTFQQIQKYEKGANRIGASRLYQFATILDVPPAYFFDGLEGQAVISRNGTTQIGRASSRERECQYV